MPNELAVPVQAAIVAPPASFAPEVPPKPHRDDLDGHMVACLAQSAGPHRDQLVNILRVIGDTPTGRTLLDQFHQRSEKNTLPIVVNVLQAGAAPPPGVVAQDLWLPENLVVAHAQEIGVRPEVQYAPAVFDELAAALNAWRALDTLEQGKQDCIEMGKRFRAELSEEKNPFTPRLRADSAESVRHDDTRARAATLSKQSGISTTTVQQAGTSAVSVPFLPSEANQASAGGVPVNAAKNDAITEETLPGDNAQADKQGKKPDALKRMKTIRRQVTRQVRRPFNALMGLLERRRAEGGGSGKPDTIPEAAVYRSDAGKSDDRNRSMTSSTSSAANSIPSNEAPPQPGVEGRLSAAAAPLITTAPSASEVGTPSTTETIVHA